LDGYVLWQAECRRKALGKHFDKVEADRVVCAQGCDVCQLNGARGEVSYARFSQATNRGARTRN
jgi:hypothetical protein